ncbi:Fc.00g104280.m01.CDS01 [Cosmosporella sp. VM-42]
MSNPPTATVGEPDVRQEISPVAMEIDNDVGHGGDKVEATQDSIHVQPAHQQTTPSADSDETRVQPENMAVPLEAVNGDAFADKIPNQSFGDGIWGDIEAIPIDSAMEGWIHYNPAMNGASFMDNDGLVGPAANSINCDAGSSSQAFSHIQDGDLGDYLRLGQGKHSATTLIEIPEHQAVIQAQDYWSSFRCNPRKDVVACPRTGGVLLGSLSHMPATDSLWGWLDLNFPSPDATSQLVSMPLLENVRDKLSAISQSFLRKALDVHQLDPAATTSSYPSPAADVSHGFLILPPVATLEHFLREYMRIFEPFYTLLPGGVLDANVLMTGGNNSASTLLILLMISQGAISDSTNEARRLSGGLTEVCRISLFDTIEKNVSVCHHHLLVHSALLFTIQAAWSGDKWLMDIGKGQRGIYLSIIRNSGLFDAHDGPLEVLPPDDNTEAEWESRRARWLDREKMTRLVHTWAILDLELSLLQDLNPLLPIAEFDLPLPEHEELFLASDTSFWQNALKTTNKDYPKMSRQPSLCTLFQQFLDDNLVGQRRRALNLTTLHLLLYPLHSLVHTFRQLRNCFAPGPTPRSFSPVTKKSTDLRMEELHALLQRWLSLYKSYSSVSSEPPDDCETINPSMIATLITYHLIALNTMVDFKEMESLARGRLSDTQLYQYGPRILEKCIQDQEKATLHAGQILYLLRNFEKKARPPWWPAALYRVTIILWAISVFYGPLWRLSSAPYVFIDVEQQGDSIDDDVKMAQLTTISYTPALTNMADISKPVLLHDPINTVETCLLAFEDGATTRFSEGIQRKLRLFLDSRNSLRDK